MSGKWKLEELIQATGGKIVSQGPNEFDGVSTDSRADSTGKIFVPLVGDNFDAHGFVKQAIERGARCIVTHKPIEQLDIASNSSLTIVQVNDTLKALQGMGREWRHKLHPKVIGITGTNGKTSTREFTQAIVSAKYPTYAARGSLNNHFGVPMSLLEIEPSHRVAIIEMGMNHPGELKPLVEMADPDVVLVTMVGRGHLEGMGTVEAIAKEKEEIYVHARKDATRIYNLDNPHTVQMKSRAQWRSRVITFSSQDAMANVQLKETLSTLDFIEVSGSIDGQPGRARIPVFGRQNINNLMAASAAALAVGVEADVIWNALPRCKTTWGRNQIVELGSGARLIFDGYNANPESMGAVIDNISRLSARGKKILVLGEMLEMGEASGALHEELGEKAGATSADLIWFVGPHGQDFTRGVESSSFSKKLLVSNSYEEKLALEVARMLEPNDIILVKGSRGMKLERVVSALDPKNFKTTY